MGGRLLEVMMQDKKIFFWGVYSNPNFGDLLTPYILNYFKIQNVYMTNDINQANSMMVGSIVRFATNNMKVFGSGIIDSKDVVNPNADYKFVRGPLTREKIISAGGNCPEVYGDAAILLPLLVEPKEKKYKVGYVPHYYDTKDIQNQYKDCRVIEVLNKNPLEVAEQISECEKIISSSLHGIIAAHCYGIPAAWVKTINAITGDGAKFRDYFASINIDVENPSTYQDPKFIDSVSLNEMSNKLVDTIKTL